MKTGESSNLFCGHRALGYVSNHVPLVSRYVRKRQENLIATSVGKSFHTYGGSKLGLLSVSGIHPEDITTLAADTFMVYSAAGNDIYAWRRGCELKHTYKGHQCKVKLLFPFGPHLISIDEESQLFVFDIKAESQIIHIEFDKKIFDITTVCHPMTYKDKILLGSSQGTLQLWNLKSGKKIYTFKGWKSPVTCIVPCPQVLDAVAIGLKSGDIIVHNLKMDETFVQFKQDWGPVTCLAFRSDRNDLLISGSSEIFDEETGQTSGHIAIWNLNERKMAGQMRDAHCGAITGMSCFPSEPILVTSSPDNTIKQWIFDMPDGGGRLLKLREGHNKPPTKIRFYGSLGTSIISAGEDSTLRSFSTETDLLNKSFGVASYNRKLAKKHKKIDNPVKMKPIVDFTTETSKETEWDNIACVHRDTLVATTWSFKQQKMGELKLRHQRFKEQQDLRESLATCLNLSICGNFVFVGYDSGHVDKFNIQSGIFRGSLESSPDQPAHPGAKVKAIVSDGLNQLVVTGDDSKQLKFWKFQTNKLVKGQIDKRNAGIRQMMLHRESALLAISLEDRSLEIVDIITRKLVRKFFDIHNDLVTDMAFSSDARWIVTSSLDKTVKVWHVPTGNLIDHIGFSSHVTSLSMSPTSDFLSTTHENDLGVYLWCNKSLYRHVSLKPINQSETEPIFIRMPTVKQSQEDILANSIENLDVTEEVEDMEESWNKDQIQDLITLSGLPPARWQNLYNLEVIKARNKPKEVVNKPKNAPFFLPTITGPDGQTRFNLETEDEDGKQEKKIPIFLEQNFTQFGQKLWDSRSDLKTTLIDDLKAMGPSAIDMELVSLSPEGGGSIELMATFLNLLLVTLEIHQDFEAVHAYLGLFLKHHSDTVIENEELIEALTNLQPVLNQSWSDLKNTLSSAATLVSFAKNSLLTSG